MFILNAASVWARDITLVISILAVFIAFAQSTWEASSIRLIKTRSITPNTKWVQSILNGIAVALAAITSVDNAKSFERFDNYLFTL